MTAAFVPPGPGEWALDRSHYPGGVTPISQWLLTDGIERGMRRVFAELGVPAETMDFGFVHGFHYSRLRPLVGGDGPPRRPPPDLVLRLVTRLHPAFRARTRAAAAAWHSSPSPAVVARWERELGPRVREANLRFQAEDPAALDDAALQAHVDGLLDHLHETFELHFWLHGYDLGPIAQYLDAALRWGIEADAAIDALAGASPTTSEPLELLVRLRALVDEATGPIESLDDVRAVSAEAAALLDDYLAERRHVLTTGYDLTDSTLDELPEVVLRSIRSARTAPDHDAETIATALREQVPVTERDEFDRLLATARSVMDMRDGNGPLTVEWPAGLLRRALLAVGDRLVERGALDERGHVLVVTPDEAHRLFELGASAAATLRERFERRRADLRLDPPQTLGDPEPPPRLDVLPRALADGIRATQVAIDHIGMGAADRGLRGSGIGTAPARGVACVADSAEDALRRLEPGQVLVVRATSPAFNSVLAIAGAVVTIDGGVLSHAAVLARELGIPAVVGAADAMTIPDGSLIEVDPAAGDVRVLS